METFGICGCFWNDLAYFPLENHLYQYHDSVVVQKDYRGMRDCWYLYHDLIFENFDFVDNCYIVDFLETVDKKKGWLKVKEWLHISVMSHVADGLP